MPLPKPTSTSTGLAFPKSRFQWMATGGSPGLASGSKYGASCSMVNRRRLRKSLSPSRSGEGLHLQPFLAGDRHAHHVAVENQRRADKALDGEFGLAAIDAYSLADEDQAVARPNRCAIAGSVDAAETQQFVAENAVR